MDLQFYILQWVLHILLLFFLMWYIIDLLMGKLYTLNLHYYIEKILLFLFIIAILFNLKFCKGS